MRSQRRRSRANPYQIFQPSDLTDTITKRNLAQDIADLEREIWSSLNPGIIQGYQTFLSLFESSDCFVGISYPEGDERPLLSYIVADEISIYSSDYQSKLARSASILGCDYYEDVLNAIPGRRIVYIQDWTRGRSDLAKSENTAMYEAFTKVMKDQGIGFLRDSRSDTSYKALKRLEAQGRVEILADFVTDTQAQVPVHTCFGYYK